MGKKSAQPTIRNFFTHESSIVYVNITLATKYVWRQIVFKQTKSYATLSLHSKKRKSFNQICFKALFDTKWHIEKGLVCYTLYNV